MNTRKSQKETKVYYRISVTQKGTLRDILESLWYGRGQEIVLREKQYHLRESGRFDPEDEKVQSTRDRVFGVAREYGGRGWAKGIYTSSPVITESSGKEKYRATFTRAEDVPDNEHDMGNHEYRIIEGARYHVYFEGDFTIESARPYKQVLIERAVDRIREVFTKEGRFPEKVTASIPKSLSQRIAEYSGRMEMKCEQKIKEAKMKRGG